FKCCLAASATEDGNSAEEEVDVKPTILPPPVEEEKVALDSESVRVATQTAKSSPSPPLVKVKDEPIDEEYEHALISSAFTASVKDEPDTAKDLRIGSVFSVPPATERQPRPIVHPLSPHMCCCHCKKSLMKGQTAFQRKGSPALFCSTICLTTSLPSVQQKTGVIFPNLKHEVILSGAVHKICSDACFNRFRTVNNLSMAGCANCGSYCHSKPLMLKLEDSNKTLCNAECLNTKITKPCTMCRTTRLLVKMVDNKNSDDSVNLFCSSSCVMAFKVQTVSASGARLNCDSCGKNTVPAYHLAMSDTSIRNFCTLPCVMAFQEKFKKSQKQVNVFTKLPIGAAQIQSVTPIQTLQDVTKGPLKLKCFQCDSNIAFKPELLQIKDKLVFFCGMDCAHEFKKDNFVTSLCEYCKIEKITRDAKRINNRDCFFCSDGCKLLFRHDLTKNWGKHCHSCVYCHSMSKKLVTAQYGGSTEDFCSEDCRSKYTMLFCHVAKCDTCGHKGKLKQSLPMLGEVKHFCDLSCLLHFCCDTVATQGEIITGVFNSLYFVLPKITNLPQRALQSVHIRINWSREATPVIANVISLAGPLTRKSNASHIQTDAVKVHPPPAPKILKNKAVLCRPLVQNKGVSCTTQTVDVEAQTDDVYPKILVVPVPVPVYIPVPMNMYSQFTPKALGLPLPVPVPVFLPVTMDSAERIMETIQEIKQKIPSDPFEAELILMAEMVAEQNEKNDKEEGPKEKKVDDLDTDDLASFLNNWEDGSSDAGLRSPGRLCGQEKLNPILDIPAGATSEPYSEPPPPAPPPMDVEADFAIKLYLSASQGRKSQRSSKGAEASTQKGGANKAVAPDVPKLESQYGVDAWKRWIQWRQTQPNLEKPRFGSRPMELKDDVLRCTTAELSYGLCCFITELKRPNGEPYSPDSLFYLCLGIQQYLFENGRVENIFMDRFYNKFSTEFNNMLRDFKPSITASGYIHSRVEEGFLWDCKQLGAYSPIVLLNTLLFFCCKYFGFTTVEQHRQLSFAHVMRCTKTNPNNTKTTFLRFYPPISINEVPVKKRKEEESKEDILEMMENTENPLRCPVRLYEFYLSKCSESVKQRTNLFYLHPERCCVPNSPLWFSFTPLDDGTMEGMLVRILTIRELHLGKRKAEGMEQKTSEDPPFIPPGEEGDGDSEG
uniref:TRASH domain-containing protein n=1 Tax=Cyclopterus lumpus TaxID=8103 RepID=A0A8C2XRK1_CYCLU